MQVLWRRLIAFGFRLLYNELAWLYDPVSWITSLGLWHAWQWVALPYLLPGGTVLEVGCGPGHLLLGLAASGCHPVGLDLSPAMLRQARRRLHRQGLALALCQGRAQNLPYAAQAFDCVVLTFPAPFVYDPGWIGHLARVLKPSGRLVIVETASFSKHTSVERCLEGLYRATGQRGLAPDLPALLACAGLTAHREKIPVNGTLVSVMLADKQPCEDYRTCTTL
jgi:ubiquinone/menaquinone biosynthesis C-methylase UbiE